MPALTTERGCGRRVAGGLYLVVPIGPNGRPIEDFLLCPPIRPQFDLPVQGQLPFWKDETLHLVDWIGETYYPHVTDWIEEARVLGISRRISLDLAQRDAGNETARSILEALTGASRLWFAHRRAWIDNLDQYARIDGSLPWMCPRQIDGHPEHDAVADDPPACVGSYWWDLDDGAPVKPPAIPALKAPDRLVVKTLPCGAEFMGRTRPPDFEPVYETAIFARFPIVQLELVRGPYGEHELVREQLQDLDIDIPILEVND